MDMQDHAILSCLDPTPEEREEKPFWPELESNPGPLGSQVTTLTTRPWLLGQTVARVDL